MNAKIARRLRKVAAYMTATQQDRSYAVFMNHRVWKWADATKKTKVHGTVAGTLRLRGDCTRGVYQQMKRASLSARLKRS